MTADMKVPHGTVAWFEMVGTLMVEAAAQAKLPSDFNICLVERYIDGDEMKPGYVQGLRFEITGGQPSFSLGALRDERGNITVEVTAAASYRLNTLYGADPSFRTTVTDLQANGKLRMDGDFTRLGGWFSTVHDRIVDRTS